MKIYTLLFGTGIAALNALALVPQFREHALLLVAGSLALAVWLVVRAALAPSETAEIDYEPPPRREPEPPPAPDTRAAEERAARHAAVSLLAVLQEKGRLVDFLMEDVSRADDAQVGAAARVVHQGCAAALREHITVEPVSTEAEGTVVTVPADAATGDYRIVGKGGGKDGPAAGKLVHKGWRAASVKIPRPLDPADDRLPPIAPAQVDAG
ncbi:MAG: DUF2760 domain-containing protein [Opitutales bacterium]|nr:DUF2760 domain-containing protein [Opitutales bacterium]